MAIEPRAAPSMAAAELQKLIDAAKPGSTLRLGEGVVVGRIVIDRPLTLRGTGAGRTIIDARDQGAAISVDAAGGDVWIENLTVTGGKSAFGGGLSIDNGARVHVAGCTFEDNLATSGAGGAIAIDRGALYVHESSIVKNVAAIGGGIYAGGDAFCSVTASIIAANLAIRGGAIAAVDRAEVDLWTCRIELNEARDEGHHLYAYACSAGRPSILVSNATLGGSPRTGLPIANDPRHPADLVLDNSPIDRIGMPTCVTG